MSKLKRYLVFQWWEYEARGGWDDLKGMTDTEEEAFQIIREIGSRTGTNYPFYIIIDTEDLEKRLFTPEDRLRFSL